MSQMDSTELVTQPEDVTECPYKEKSFKAAEKQVYNTYIMFSHSLKLLGTCAMVV